MNVPVSLHGNPPGVYVLTSEVWPPISAFEHGEEDSDIPNASSENKAPMESMVKKVQSVKVVMSADEYTSLAPTLSWGYFVH